MTLECLHADTCLPDYWGGHHLPHISVPAYRMTAEQLRSELRREFLDGAICGNYPNNDKWDNEALDAIRDMEITKDIVFEDIECGEDHDVYAYFVFREM